MLSPTSCFHRDSLFKAESLFSYIKSKIPATFVIVFLSNRNRNSREKIKLDEVELRSPSFDRFSFLLYVHFYDFTAAGIWVVNESPD